MPTPSKAIVHTLEGSDEYELSSKTTGRDLYDEVLHRIGLEETPFFNLQYIDKKESPDFVKMDKKITKLEILRAKDAPYEFTLRAQYYPELVEEELRQPNAQRFLWLQMRDSIVTDECYCPGELCVLFAAQSMQAFHGDFQDSLTNAVNAEKELPQRVLLQHSLTIEEWNQRIINAWKALAGTPQQQAIVDYLSVAQDLEQYGVTYFEIHNKKGTRLWLGVHNLGMDIYEFRNKVTPRLGFPWTEIRNISFNDKKFTIKMVAKDVPDFKFFSGRFKQNKRILALCVENHQLYVARRRSQIGNSDYEDRGATEAKIKKTKERLMAIRADLESVKDQSKLTEEDKIHAEQEAAGMNKFKTMLKAQSGDARKRIEQFEDLEDVEC